MSIDTLSTEGRTLRVAVGKWVDSSSDIGSCYTTRYRVHITNCSRLATYIHEVEPLITLKTELL